MKRVLIIGLIAAALALAVPIMTAEDEAEPPTHALIEEVEGDAEADCHCDSEGCACDDADCEDCVDCDGEDCPCEDDCMDCADEDCICEGDSVEEEDSGHCGGGGGCH